jgi:fatty acid desaturase
MVWAFLVFPLLGLGYVMPRLVPWMLPFGLYVGLCAGALSHNQNHCPAFCDRKFNSLLGIWLSIFYGFPTFTWISTHNQNHHKYVDKPGDATITWRYTRKNTWFSALAYLFASAYWQQPVIRRWVARAKATNPPRYREIVAQSLILVGTHVTLFLLALSLRGLRLGALTYLCTFGACAISGPWALIFVNYIQHVHCDPWSTHNHSRNFVSRFTNYVLFNNGYHTVHHERPGLHWSELPEAHARVAHLIDPALNEHSITRYCLRHYLLGIFDARYGTEPLNRAARAVPPRGRPARAALRLARSAAGALEQADASLGHDERIETATKSRPGAWSRPRP